jgi:hypothetical protein
MARENWRSTYCAASHFLHLSRIRRSGSFSVDHVVSSLPITTTARRMEPNLVLAPDGCP